MKTFGCPVCGKHQNPIHVSTFTANESAEHFGRSGGAKDTLSLEEHIQKIWGFRECSIFRCTECSSRFAEPHVAGDSKFYSLAFPESSYPVARWEFDLTKKLALKALTKGGHLLEVGAGSGSFIKLLLNTGLEKNRIVVTEFSSDGAAALKSLGVNVEVVDFRDGVLGAPFRVVALFQTFEHLDRLNEALQSLARLTTPDAEIFISVPNVHFIDWQEQNIGLPDMPPNHITAFSADGLHMLFSQNGWKITSIKLQRKKSFISRYKESALQKFSFPSSNLELKLSQSAKLDKVHFRKTRLVTLSFLVNICNWSWMYTAPPENIWAHIKKDPNF
jgi:SAM-dependent methyltransferase